MKPSEIKGEDALDRLADMIEPAFELTNDPKVRELVKEGDKAKAISYAIKNHKRAIIELLAAYEGMPAEEYEVSLISLPVRLLEILNDPELQELFT